MSARDAQPSGPPIEAGPSAATPRWSAGIVNHGTYDDLARCLASLRRQTDPPTRVAVYDTGESTDRFEASRLAHPEATFECGPNRGYAGGANQVIARLLDTPPRIDFVLVLNPDVELESDYAARLIASMLGRPRVAIGSGKLLRPDARTIDSAGITFPRHRRPRDRGSEQIDIGQFDEPERVDAASGAAMMLRVGALSDLEVDGELFDESFFAYHEDTDLCWRARLYGWQILYEPRAVALHRRGWQRERRAVIPVATRRHSFKNHYLQIVKNESSAGFVRNLPWLLVWEFLRLGFALLRDRPMCTAYRDAWRALPLARRKRALIQSKARRRCVANQFDVAARLDPDSEVG